MINDPKEKSSQSEGTNFNIVEEEQRSGLFGLSRFLNVENTLLLMGTSLQVLLGMTVVTMAILGLMQPLWLSTMMSILGSVAIMSGFYFMYHMASKRNTFDSLINKAIRRVIESQN